MEQVRSFIAIELPDEIKSALAQLQDQLKTGKQPGIKWVDPDGIHLTLKFLGNVGANKIGDITKAMEAAAQGLSPFMLEIKELGTFPNLKRVKVVWVGVGGDMPRLNQLQQRIEAELSRLGFTPELRPFAPHLTLARVREQASLREQQSLGQLIASTKFTTSYHFRIDSISLMKSKLTPEGAIYSRLSLVELK